MTVAPPVNGAVVTNASSSRAVTAPVRLVVDPGEPPWPPSPSVPPEPDPGPPVPGWPQSLPQPGAGGGRSSSTPEQAKLTAQAANAAGDVADSYYYMSEYHLMSGDLPLAINQLQLALSVPKISDVQRARFEARLEEVQQAMPKRMRRQVEQDSGNRRRAAS